MRKLGLLPTLLLAGCAAGTTLTLAQVVADATLAAQGICAIAPTAASITAIIEANSASGTASEQEAQQAATIFCGAVTGKTTPTTTTASLRRFKVARSAPVAMGNGVMNYGSITVNGKTVPLEGTPVK